MAFAHWMILAAACLPYATIALVKWPSWRRFDNHNPRAWLERQTGWQQRGDWAHRNHFEVFPIFAAAVLVAETTHAPQGRIDLLAGVFILLRLVYTALYLADRPSLRSAVWALGFAVVVWLFLLAA